VTVAATVAAARRRIKHRMGALSQKSEGHAWCFSDKIFNPGDIEGHRVELVEARKKICGVRLAEIELVPTSARFGLACNHSCFRQFILERYVSSGFPIFR
jgi:hypothetical protein